MNTRTVATAAAAAANKFNGRAWQLVAGCCLVLLGMAPAATARAADGCLVLLCLAAPNWRAVPQCVAPVRAVLRDLARGRPFPTCAMAGAGNSAAHGWASAPGNCPPQYVSAIEGESTTMYFCAYSGAVTVHLNGSPFSRTWWNLGGDTVTEFSAQAKERLGRWDTRFDDDYARWLAAQPKAPEPCVNC